MGRGLGWFPRVVHPAPAHASTVLAAANTRPQTRVWLTGRSAAPLRRLQAEVDATDGQRASAWRAYPELAYSGALTKPQVDDIWSYMSLENQSIILGVPGWSGNANAGKPCSRGTCPPYVAVKTISTRAPFGLAYALLQHDMVERFLLHFYAISAHAYTRGSWTTPESSNIADRDTPTVAYAVTGVATVPTYLKWMLVFEEPETRTLWLAKATPRDWLEQGAGAVAVEGATTRYGRVSFALEARSSPGAAFAVHGNVTVPASLSKDPPAGGLVLRVRAPLEHAGKLSAVTVGGKPWSAFSAAEETITFGPGTLGGAGLDSIVATFSA